MRQRGTRKNPRISSEQPPETTPVPNRKKSEKRDFFVELFLTNGKERCILSLRLWLPACPVDRSYAEGGKTRKWLKSELKIMNRLTVLFADSSVSAPSPASSPSSASVSITRSRALSARRSPKLPESASISNSSLLHYFTSKQMTRRDRGGFLLCTSVDPTNLQQNTPGRQHRCVSVAIQSLICRLRRRSRRNQGLSGKLRRSVRRPRSAAQEARQRSLRSSNHRTEWWSTPRSLHRTARRGCRG